MNIYAYSIYWRHAQYNFEHGVIKAKSMKDAEDKLNKIYSNLIEVDISEIHFDDNGIFTIYSS